jgi:hypothetical protein
MLTIFFVCGTGPSPWATLPALFFWDRVSPTICLDWLRTMILLIFASWVARITGVRHWHPALLTIFFLKSGSVVHFCSTNYSRGWGERISWVCKFKTILGIIAKANKQNIHKTVSEKVEKLEPLCITCGNLKFYSHSRKQFKILKIVGEGQLAAYLPSKSEVLSSNPSTTRKK